MLHQIFNIIAETIILNVIGLSNLANNLLARFFLTFAEKVRKEPNRFINVISRRSSETVWKEVKPKRPKNKRTGSR